MRRFCAKNLFCKKWVACAKKNYVKKNSSPGFEPAISCSLGRHSNHSAILTDLSYKGKFASHIERQRKNGVCAQIAQKKSRKFDACAKKKLNLCYFLFANLTHASTHASNLRKYFFCVIALIAPNLAQIYNLAHKKSPFCASYKGCPAVGKAAKTKCSRFI